jgi:hypothetical protein
MAHRTSALWMLPAQCDLDVYVPRFTHLHAHAVQNCEGPLYTAAMVGSLPCVQKLVEAGASVDARNPVRSPRKCSTGALTHARVSQNMSPTPGMLASFQFPAVSERMCIIRDMRDSLSY